MIWRDPVAEGNAFLANEDMKDRQSYLESGRRFEGLSDDALRADWVLAFRAWVRDGFPPGRHLMADFRAELRLRDLETPDHLVRPEIDLMVEEIRRSDPHDPGVTAAFTRWREERERAPKN